jgi:ribosomal protein S21
MIEEELSAGRAPTRQNDDSWWHALNNRSSGPYQSRNATAAAIPGNQYSGRSISTTKGPWEVMNAFRQLGGRLARSGLKADVRRSEYHEKPSEKKRRLASERHRRRFQEMVCRFLPFLVPLFFTVHGSAGGSEAACKVEQDYGYQIWQS